jgi:hypothetical protein
LTIKRDKHLKENKKRRIGMDKERNGFIDNWQISVKNESAKHISGLDFRHIPKGIDGREKIEVSNWPQWGRNLIDNGHTIEQCDKLQKQLYDEFVYIYKHIIIPAKHTLFCSFLLSYVKLCIAL